jgi:hypothetical protein
VTTLSARKRSEEKPQVSVTWGFLRDEPVALRSWTDMGFMMAFVGRHLVSVIVLTASEGVPLLEGETMMTR